MEYSIDLANRFVSDYKLPIPITNDEKLFNYYLKLFEKDFSSKTKYEKLVNLINNNFNGKPNDFLEEYYNIRENIIQAMLTNPHYLEFNNMDLNKYNIKDKPNVSSNNVYNCENIGKTFLSIDLKKANFQALKFVNPKIIFDSDTYEDFIGKFTDLDYVKESKYSRQVIFGKLNPKRHITVEKYIINEVRKLFEKYIDGNENFKLISLSNDEVVYECQNETIISSIDAVSLVNKIKKNIDIDVSIEMYGLEGYELYSENNRKANKKFFIKHNFLEYNKKMKCVPEPFYPIIYKLYKSFPLNNNDRRIVYEGMNAYLTDDFHIRKILNNYGV